MGAFDHLRSEPWSGVCIWTTFWLAEGGIWTADQSFRKNQISSCQMPGKKERELLSFDLTDVHKWLCNTRCYQTLCRKESFRERWKQLKESKIRYGTTHSGIFDWLRGVWYCDKIKTVSNAECYFSNKIIYRRDQGCKMSFRFPNTTIKQEFPCKLNMSLRTKWQDVVAPEKLWVAITFPAHVQRLFTNGA